MTTRPLWECPGCGRRFVTARVWHSCVVRDVDSFFARHRHLEPAYEAFEELARSLGPIRVEVLKTRISFTARTRFAGVTRLRRDAVVAHFRLDREVRGDRLVHVEHIGRDWIHELLLRTEADVDDELREWLAEAYALGAQPR